MSGAQYEVTRLSRRLERKEEVFLRRYLLDRLVWTTETPSSGTNMFVGSGSSTAILKALSAIP